MVYSTRQFVVCLTLCYFVLVFFSPFGIVITSPGEERANLSAFRMFDRFVLVWICRFPLPPGVWEGLRFVIVALPGLFFYLFFFIISSRSSRETLFLSCLSSSNNACSILNFKTIEARYMYFHETLYKCDQPMCCYLMFSIELWSFCKFFIHCQ